MGVFSTHFSAKSACSILSLAAMTDTLTPFSLIWLTETKSHTTNATRYVLIATVSSNSSRTWRK